MNILLLILCVILSPAILLAGLFGVIILFYLACLLIECVCEGINAISRKLSKNKQNK